MTSGDERYGLPLWRAHWQFVSEELADRAIVNWDTRRSFGSNNSRFCNPWRYEVFSIPGKEPAGERITWQHRKANPIIDAEAYQQENWLARSVELRTKLEAGHLVAFGRRNDIAGDWVEIPAIGWHLLSVPYATDFQNWRLGHAIGGGFNLWDVRVLDRIGIPLRDADITYGEFSACGPLQRARAYRRLGLQRQERSGVPTADAGRVPRGSATLKDVPNPDLGRSWSPPPRASEYPLGVERALQEGVVALLAAGLLRGFGTRSAGIKTAISRADWLSGTPDFEASTVQVGRMRYEEVFVRPPHPIADQADDRLSGAQWVNKDVELWWQRRAAANPGDRWPFSEKADIAAAKAEFHGISRPVVRDLRSRLTAHVTSGRR